MSLTLKFLAAAVFVIGLVVVWQPAKKFFMQDICLDSGGKWANNGNYCITKDCASDSSCRPSFHNFHVCTSLNTGIDKDELFFQLGMPRSIIGDKYVFDGGGGAPPITAILKDNVVLELACKT